MLINNYFKYLFATLVLYTQLINALTLETIYGSYEIDEPVLIELIESHPVQRLKDIDQYGVLRYVSDCKTFNRYDHCIGVLILLRINGASLPEQIAGLLHDASHTVFSHVGDFVFDLPEGSEESYQDSMHGWYLKRSGLESILLKYNLPADLIADYGDHFIALEQPLPELCADRIDYNLRGALVEGLLSEEEVKNIVEKLEYADGHWYFTTQQSARDFAVFSLYGSTKIWGSAGSLMINRWMANAIKQAFRIGLITPDEFQFSIDDLIWQKLMNCSDSLIKNNLYYVFNYKDYAVPCSPGDAELILYGKFRGVDPLVLTGEGLKKLTTLDLSYAKDYLSTAGLMKSGWSIKLNLPVAKAFNGARSGQVLSTAK